MGHEFGRQTADLDQRWKPSPLAAGLRWTGWAPDGGGSERQRQHNRSWPGSAAGHSYDNQWKLPVRRFRRWAALPGGGSARTEQRDTVDARSELGGWFEEMICHRLSL